MRGTRRAVTSLLPKNPSVGELEDVGLWVARQWLRQHGYIDRAAWEKWTGWLGGEAAQSAWVEKNGYKE